MIEIYLNKPEFEYDIHSLIKAFFPKDNVEIYYTDDALKAEKDNVISLAETEGLTAHANSIKVRFED